MAPIITLHSEPIIARLSSQPITNIDLAFKFMDLHLSALRFQTRRNAASDLALNHHQGLFIHDLSLSLMHDVTTSAHLSVSQINPSLHA